MMLMIACAPSEGKFESENISITCEKMFECTAEEDIAVAQDMGFWSFGSDVEECVEILTESSEGDDTASTDLLYNKQYAKDCLAAMEEMSCDDFSSGLPAACEDVYSEE
jgi:hypothetical protein